MTVPADAAEIFLARHPVAFARGQRENLGILSILLVHGDRNRRSVTFGV